MLTIEFYQRHLDRVSRSFAYCISQLEAPMRSWVSMTYLICRILDTVEDAPWKKLNLQLRQFGEFDSFLFERPRAEIIGSWRENFPDQIPEGEKLLLLDSGLIFEDLHGVPVQVRGIIQEMVATMSAGMQYYSQLREERGQLRLLDLNEVNQYCFFVAGIVGETLARLLRLLEPQHISEDTKHSFVLEAHHFGLFLQKINLLKDQLKDEDEGRFFVYSRSELKQSLAENAFGAWQFLTRLPLHQRGFRLFCAQSLFLGLASLPWTDKSFSKKSFFKIPRWSTLRLFESLRQNIDDNQFLEGLFKKLSDKGGISVVARIGAKISSRNGASMGKEEVLIGNEAVSLLKSSWYHKLYNGQLMPEDFFKLGMVENCS